MSNLAVIGNALPPVTPEALEKLLKAEEVIGAREQIHVQTEHILHGGMYSRTVRLAPAVVIVGALIKVPTMLILHGEGWVFAGDQWYPYSDYQVIPAKPGRKQVFVTRTLTELTMIFPTKARTVAEAEAEFTDETDKLLSRRDGDEDIVTITEVEPCQG